MHICAVQLETWSKLWMGTWTMRYSNPHGELFRIAGMTLSSSMRRLKTKVQSDHLLLCSLSNSNCLIIFKPKSLDFTPSLWLLTHLWHLTNQQLLSCHCDFTSCNNVILCHHCDFKSHTYELYFLLILQLPSAWLYCQQISMVLSISIQTFHMMRILHKSASMWIYQGQKIG